MKLFINASPKLYKSSSNYFINKLKDDKDKVILLYRDDFTNVDYTPYESIIIVSPLYVDGVTSKLVEYMEYIKNNKVDISNKNIYFISNSGFLEYEQNRVSDEIINNFAVNNSAYFKGYLNIGSGPILGENKFLYKLLSIDFYIKIKKFKQAINDLKSIYLNTRIHPVSKKMYIKCANMSWKRKQNKFGFDESMTF